jgi:hypothetical protein
VANAVINAAPSGAGGSGRDGRPLFDGQGGVVLALNLSGALASSGSDGGGPQAHLPGSGIASPLQGSHESPGAAASERSGGLGGQLPRRSDLLTDFKPYDRASLEQAIDRFLDRFDDFADELSRSKGPSDLLTEIMAVAVALTAAKVVLRLFWRSRDDDEEALADPDVCVTLDPCPGALDV